MPNWEIINIINDQNEQSCSKIDDTIQPHQSFKATTINDSIFFSDNDLPIFYLIISINYLLVDTTSNNMIQLIAVNQSTFFNNSLIQ